MKELLKKISCELEMFIEGNYWPNAHILLDEINVELEKLENFERSPVAVIIQKEGFIIAGEPSYNELEELMDIQELLVGTKLYCDFIYEGVRVTAKSREGGWIYATDSSPAPTNATLVFDSGVEI